MKYDPDPECCPGCGGPLERHVHSTGGRWIKSYHRVRFHCGNMECEVSFVERDYQNHTRYYDERIVLCVL